MPELDRWDARGDEMHAGDVILNCVLVQQQQQPSEEQGVDVCVGRRPAILVVG